MDRILRALLVGCVVAVGAAGEAAVFVTPDLPHDYAKAQNASASKVGNFSVHAGFFTIDNATNANTYFLYSPVRTPDAGAPLILWLSGATPGASSLGALFEEIGPFSIDLRSHVQARDMNWNVDHHLLVLDAPLGAGFSFVDDPGRLPQDAAAVGSDLLLALVQFYELFPALRRADLFVAGRAYAAKYALALARAIDGHNDAAGAAATRLPFRGVALGNAVFDPLNQCWGYGDWLHAHGMIDANQAVTFGDFESAWKKTMARKRWADAFAVFDEMIGGVRYAHSTLYANLTGAARRPPRAPRRSRAVPEPRPPVAAVAGMGSNVDDIGQGPDHVESPYWRDWLARGGKGRAALNAGDVPFDAANATVDAAMVGDWMRDAVDDLVLCLEKYRVLVYNGALDVLRAPPHAERALRAIKWSGQKAFLAAPQMAWTVDWIKKRADLAGYVHIVHNFTQLVNRGAGLRVPENQASRSVDMIHRFVKGISLGPI